MKTVKHKEVEHLRGRLGKENIDTMKMEQTTFETQFYITNLTSEKKPF